MRTVILVLLLCAAAPAGELADHIRALSSDSIAERDAAADAIATLGPDAAKAVPALTAWLGEFGTGVRYHLWPDRALAALKAIGPAAKDAIPAIERVMRMDPGPPPREGEEYRDFHAPAGVAIAAMGEPGRVALLRALWSDNPFAGLSAIDGLRTLGEKAAFAVPALADAVHKRLPEAVRRMHWDPQQGAIGPLHHEAVALLGEVGPLAKAAVPALLKRCEPDSFVALSRIAPEDPEVVKVFGPLVEDGSDGFLFEAADAFPAFGGAFLPHLVARLKRGRWSAGRPVAILASLGEQAVPALHEVLRDVPRPAWILDALVQADADTTPYVEEAIPLLFDEDPNAWAPAARALERSGDAGDVKLLPRVIDRAWHEHPWPVLWQATPALAKRLGPAWWERRRPEPSDDGFDEEGLRRTPLCGGSGGSEFTILGPDHAPLRAFRRTYAWVGGHLIVKSLAPIFRGEGVAAPGTRCGRGGKWPSYDAAPDGYAVGALIVKGGHRVDGFAVVFMRDLGDRLDPEDVVLGPWRGGTDGGPAIILGGEGRRIVGIHGRRGADLDALGLVEERGR